jgi:hypothetical protein
MQDPRNIADPTPVERHLDDLVLYRGQTAGIRIATQERPATLLALLTAKALLAIAGFAMLHDRVTLTMRTPYPCLGHRLSLL